MRQPPESGHDGIKMEVQDEQANKVLVEDQKEDPEDDSRDDKQQVKKGRATFKQKRERDESTLFLTAMGDQPEDEDEEGGAQDGD